VAGQRSTSNALREHALNRGGKGCMFHEANELTAWLHEDLGLWVWVLCLISRRGVANVVFWFREVTQSAETTNPGLPAEAEVGRALEWYRAAITCKDVG
jgi:hypothetical protein